MKARSLGLSLLMVLPLQAACGWIFVEGPPANHAQLEYFTCTESRTLPILDVIWGGLNVLGAVGAMATSDADWDYDASREATVVSGLAWGVVSGLSAKSGFDKVAACRAALLDLAERGPVPLTPAVEPAGEAEVWHPPMRLPIDPFQGVGEAGDGDGVGAGDGDERARDRSGSGG